MNDDAKKFYDFRIRMNEVIKQRWVALGPRNYGKSVEWKLEGDPWDTEGLYSDHTRAQCYKTFCVRNLRIFAVCPWQDFPN